MAEINAGWYPDPSGNLTKLRYWNGTKWTDDYSDATAVAATAAATTVATAVTDQPAQTEAATTSVASSQTKEQDKEKSKIKNPGRSFAVASLILGIISIISVFTIDYSSVFTGNPAIILADMLVRFTPGIVGIGLGIIGYKKARAVGLPCGVAVAGIIASLVGIVLLILITLYTKLFVA